MNEVLSRPFYKKTLKYKKFRISEPLEDLEVLKGLEVQS